MENMKEMLKSLVDTPSTEAISNIEHETSNDPIMRLPEEILIFIFDYLSVMEVLRATEVSKLWKCFIESNQRIFNRVMDQVVAKPDNTDMTSVLKFLENLRPYKHMRSQFSFHFQDFSYFIHYGDSLVTLELNVPFYVFPPSFMSSRNFPRLKKLKIWCKNEPYCDDYLDGVSDLIRLCKFPVLTHLLLLGCFDVIYGRSWTWREPANLEFLLKLQNSLTHLQINSNISQEQLFLIFKELKKLERLQFKRIVCHSLLDEPIVQEFIHHNLKVIYMEEVKYDLWHRSCIVTFLINHAPCLEILFCTEISGELFYNRMNNRRFDIVVYPDMDFDEISGKF